ncbi:MAG: ATP-binding cassette domain-containing protein, partial [Bacillota bacterium]
MALKVRGIVKEFGSVQVLRSVAFDLAAGERAGLVGVNGSGKSTLMGILAGRLQADEGSVTWVAGSPVISYLCQGGEWDPASPLSRQLPGVAPELLARCGLDENVL